MPNDLLKDQVQTILREQWPDFVKSHPHLAAGIDDDFWPSVIADSIESDPVYRAAMNDASALGTLLDRGPAIARDFVSRWLKLIG